MEQGTIQEPINYEELWEQEEIQSFPERVKEDSWEDAATIEFAFKEFEDKTKVKRGVRCEYERRIAWKRGFKNWQMYLNKIYFIYRSSKPRAFHSNPHVRALFQSEEEALERVRSFFLKADELAYARPYVPGSEKQWKNFRARLAGYRNYYHMYAALYPETRKAEWKRHNERREIKARELGYKNFYEWRKAKLQTKGYSSDSARKSELARLQGFGNQFDKYAKKKGFKTTHQYKNFVAQRQGFLNENQRRNERYKALGFKGRRDYQNHQALKKGFKSYLILLKARKYITQMLKTQRYVLNQSTPLWVYHSVNTIGFIKSKSFFKL